MTLILEPTTQTFESAYRTISGDWTVAKGPLDFDGDIAIEGGVGRQASIRVQGSINVGKNVDAANIVCTGELNVESGAIVGGRTAVFLGVVCRNLGDARATPTQIVIGVDELFLESAERRIVEIQTARQKADAFNKKLSPMLQLVKSLSAGQREQLTELLSQAQELEQRAGAATEQLQSRLVAAANQTPAACKISGELFAGTSIIFPGGAADVHSSIKGPIEIVQKRAGAAISLHAKHARTGKMTPLQSVAHNCRIQSLIDRL